MADDIDPTLIKFYECATWTEGNAHGGDIDTGDEITSGADQNVFDDVSDAERVAGDTEYRKIFIRNENTGTWAAVKAWILQFTLAADDEVHILRGGRKSTQSNPTALTGTVEFATSTAIVGTGTAFLTELASGEKIYNATDDAESDGKEIASIADDTHITLKNAYAGTAGAGKTANITGIDQCSFVQPNAKAHGDVLSCGSLAQNEYAGIWIKRIVQAGAKGYTSNEFKLKFESS